MVIVSGAALSFTRSTVSEVVRKFQLQIVGFGNPLKVGGGTRVALIGVISGMCVFPLCGRW
jgi:hypothetical protein